MKPRRIIVNNDFYNILQIEPPLTDQDIYNAVDKMAGTQVDSLFLMLPMHLGTSERDYLPNDIIKLYETPQRDPWLEHLQSYLAAGKDPFAMLVQRAHQHGMEIFGSMRMNDTHYKDQPFNPWLEQFYYDNAHNRIGPAIGRQGTEYDYRKSAVRERVFASIRAAFDQYDIDGLELDCTRNCRFFPTENADECAPVLTNFVCEIRAYLDELGRQRGRRLHLCVTVPCSLYEARKQGVDIPAWARLRLIDMLAMSTPFNVDFDRDIHDTCRKVPGVQVYAGCDRNINWPGRTVPREAYRALAMNYLRQGACGVYLYNVMAWTIDHDRLPEIVRLQGGQGGDYGDGVLMCELGDMDVLQHLDKLYIMSQGAETADKPYASLPVAVPAGGEVTLRLMVGDDVMAAADRVKNIELQVVSPDCGNYNNYTVKLNGVDLSRLYAFTPHAEVPPSALLFPEPGNEKPPLPLENIRRHAVRPVDLHVGLNFITIASYRDAMTVSDVELAIRYRKPHG